MNIYIRLKKSDFIVADFSRIGLHDWVEGIGFLNSYNILDAVKFMGNTLQEECQEIQDMANNIHEELTNIKEVLREIIYETDEMINSNSTVGDHVRARIKRELAIEKARDLI